MNKFTLMALTLAFGITGCGGSSDSTPPPVKPTPAAFTLKAIDGYLVDAEVYVDRNSNMVADDIEFIGLTDTKGEYPVTLEDSHYRIIIRAVGGKTYDLDSGGRVSRTYEMINNAGNAVVSPYSTLSVVNGVTTESIANDVGYSESAITGDYVDAKGTDADAEKVHLLARSTVNQLGTTIADTNTNRAHITSVIESLPAQIADLENDGTNLDTVVFNKNGVTKDMLPTVDVYLNNVTLYQFSTNENTFEKEGYSKLEFESKEPAARMNSRMSLFAEPVNKTMAFSNVKTTESFTTDVTVDVNAYTRANDSRTEDFIYLSDEFALTVSNANTLDFATTDASIVDPNTGEVSFNFIPAEETMFRGQTIYWLIDNAEGVSTPNPVLNTFKFDVVGDMGMYTRNGVNESFSWYISGDNQITIVRENGMKDLIFQPVVINDDMIVSVMRHAPMEANKYSRIPMFLVKDKNLATNLYNKWANK